MNHATRQCAGAGENLEYVAGYRQHQRYRTGYVLAGQFEKTVDIDGFYRCLIVFRQSAHHLVADYALNEYVRTRCYRGHGAQHGAARVFFDDFIGFLPAERQRLPVQLVLRQRKDGRIAQFVESLRVIVQHFLQRFGQVRHVRLARPGQVLLGTIRSNLDNVFLAARADQGDGYVVLSWQTFAQLIGYQLFLRFFQLVRLVQRQDQRFFQIQQIL